MYASPVTRMMSQLSQPSSSISARVVGRTGAMPNRCAQYGRYENSGLVAADDTGWIDYHPPDKRSSKKNSRGYSPPSHGSPAFFLPLGPRLFAGGGVGAGIMFDGCAAGAAPGAGGGGGGPAPPPSSSPLSFDSASFCSGVRNESHFSRSLGAFASITQPCICADHLSASQRVTNESLK